MDHPTGEIKSQRHFTFRTSFVSPWASQPSVHDVLSVGAGVTTARLDKQGVPFFTVGRVLP